MKKMMTIVLAVVASWGVSARVAVDSIWRKDVRTVVMFNSTTGDNPQKALPVPMLTLGARGRLVVEFDVMGTRSERLHWSIRHCDRCWVPDDLQPEEFMTGFAEGTIEDFEFSFTTTVEYVHYRCLLPDRYAAFTHSGNYELTISSEEDLGKSGVLLTRRFCVSEQKTTVRATNTRPYDGIGVGRRQEGDVAVATDQRPEYLTVAVQQNGRLDNMRLLEFSGYEGQAVLFANRQCNIFDGGNTFRYFDCSNLRGTGYNVSSVENYGGEQFVVLNPEDDRSRKHYLNETVLNGGMKVNIWDRENPRLEADYVWVNFSLPMQQPYMDGNVHVVGAITDWKMDSTSMMQYNPTIKAYTLRLFLKQGYYSYQLLYANGQYSQWESKTAQLEGDHSETSNRYTVYVYQHTPADRGDRLLAVKSFIAIR